MQQVFKQVVGQATVAENCFTRRRDSIRLAGIGRQLWQLLIAAVEANALQQALIRVNGRAAYVRTHAEYGDLPEAHGFLVGHAEDIERGEVRTQQACAVHQPLEGNDHRQHAIHCQPAIGVIEKQPLHAVVRHLANFGVVGRIQIEQ